MPRDESSERSLSRRALLAAAAAAGCTPGELLAEGGPLGSDSGGAPVDSGSGRGPTADSGVPSTPPPAEQPNVLLLFPDQWRAQATGYAGDPNAVTPALDALAAQSVSFTQAVSNSAVCTPARALMLTGVMPWVHGMDDNGARLPDGVETIGTALRSLGYRCGWIGKWHLEGHLSSGWVPQGRRFGFDDAWAAHNFHHRYLAPELFFDQPTPVQRDDVWQPVWETDLALDAIDAAQAAGGPWCLAVSWGPPHPNVRSPADWSLDVPPELLAAIDPEALSYRDNVPSDRLDPSPSDPYGVRGFLHGYYACIRAMDEQIGRVLDHLHTRGLDRDTLVVFTSDHGEMGGSHGLYKKSVWFEESVRVPLLFRWPGGFGGGRRYDTSASLLDLAPTLQALCSGAPPAEWLHGDDLSPWLRGEVADAPQRTSFIARRPEGRLAWRGVRTATHKLLALADGSATLLYDLRDDPYETRNAVDDPSQADVREVLEADLAQWRDRAADPTLS